MPAGKVGRYCIHDTRFNQRVEIDRIVSPPRCDAIKRRNVDHGTPISELSRDFDGLARQETWMVGVSSNDLGGGVSFGQVYKRTRRRRGIVKYRRISDPSRLAGDFLKSSQRCRDRRHDAVGNDGPYLLRLHHPCQAAVSQLGLERLVRYPVCRFEITAKDCILQTPRHGRDDRDTRLAVDRAGNEPVLLRTTAKCLAAADFAESLCPLRQQLICRCLEVP